MNTENDDACVVDTRTTPSELPLALGASTTVRGFPRPYKQGQLDTLCGVYAIINACKNACFTLDPFLWVDGRKLVKAMVAKLEQNGELGNVLQNAQTDDQMELCLQATKDWLLQSHRLGLQWSHPLVDGSIEKAPAAFQLLEDHLRNAGCSAILRFRSSNYLHWTAIKDIKPGRMLLSDSAWFRPMAISSFEIELPALRTKRFCFEQDDLLFFNISKT